MKKKVSLKDIAQRVGVSIASVSYVLNNQKLDRISKGLAQKIKDTAAELNYRTNQVARSLKTSRTHTIGLIVSDISNSFSSRLARIIEDEAEKFGYTVIFGSSDESTPRLQRLIDVLLNHQVDGLIVAPTEDSEVQINRLAEQEVPLVLLDRYFLETSLSYIAIDNFTAAYNLTKHLVQQGCKKIGLVTYQSTLVNLDERRKGYEGCLRDNGIEPDMSWIKEAPHINTRPVVEAAVQQLLQQPIDGLMFASNTLSGYGLKYINALSIRVPDDLAIVAFDQSDAADLFYAPVTHARQPLQQMGRLAVETLMQHIEDNRNKVQLKMEAELVIRASSLYQRS